jgi:hypothetical protein
VFSDASLNLRTTAWLVRRLGRIARHVVAWELIQVRRRLR